MDAFFTSFLNRERLHQQMNMIRHHAGSETFDFFPVPEMAGFQSPGAGFGRKHQFVVRLPGNVIGKTGNLKVREDCVCGRWVL